MNRLKKWWNSLFWNYTPTIHKICNLEGKRYADYVTESYNENEQVFILKELHKELILNRQEQIKNYEVEVIQKKEDIAKSKKNLEKLIMLYREA